MTAQSLNCVLKNFYTLSPPQDVKSQTYFFESKLILSLILGVLFLLFDLTRFVAPYTESWIITRHWAQLIIIALQTLLIVLPHTFFLLSHIKNHFSKLPLILAIYLGLSHTALVIWSQSDTLVFIEVANTAILVLCYVFYNDLKSYAEALQTTKSLEKHVTLESRKWYNENKTEMVPSQSLVPQDKILVRPGEVIPRDGVILSGMTSVDESGLTHSKLPLHKAKGDVVYAGTLNRDGNIVIEITNTHSEDVLSLIQSKAQKAGEENSPLKTRAQFITFFYPIFFIVMSLVLGGYFYFVKHSSAYDVLWIVISLLLTSPLGIDALSRILRTRLIGGTFEKGIVVSDAKMLERLGRIRTIFFNKTGILTEGKFAHSQDFVQSGNNLGNVLCVFFSLEETLDNPLAKAMNTHVWYNEIERLPVLNSKFHPGLGVTGTLRLPNQNTLVAHVGNLRFMKRQQCQISKELKNKIDELETLGETVILCGYDGEVRGIMTFADTLRRNVRKALKRIHKMKIHTALITGDTEKTVTQHLGDLYFDQIYSRCTPEEKVAQIDKIQKPSSLVALVTNDIQSQSFQNAKVTISTDCGLNIRQHPADIIIMSPHIQKLSWLVEQTRLYQNALRIALWGSALIGLFILIFTTLGALQPQLVVVISALWSILLLENLAKARLNDD